MYTNKHTWIYTNRLSTYTVGVKSVAWPGGACAPPDGSHLAVTLGSYESLQPVMNL